MRKLQVTRITINARYRYASIDGKIHPLPIPSLCLFIVCSSTGRSSLEIGEICRLAHVCVCVYARTPFQGIVITGERERERVTAVTQAANVFHLIRFDLLNCINRGTAWMLLSASFLPRVFRRVLEPAGSGTATALRLIQVRRNTT